MTEVPSNAGVLDVEPNSAVTASGQMFSFGNSSEHIFQVLLGNPTI